MTYILGTDNSVPTIPVLWGLDCQKQKKLYPAFVTAVWEEMDPNFKKPRVIIKAVDGARLRTDKTLDEILAILKSANVVMFPAENVHTLGGQTYYLNIHRLSVLKEVKLGALSYAQVKAEGIPTEGREDAMIFYVLDGNEFLGSDFLKRKIVGTTPRFDQTDNYTPGAMYA